MFYGVPDEEANRPGGHPERRLILSAISQTRGFRFAFSIVVILAVATGIAWLVWPHGHPLFSFAKPVDFSRDIRPIFNQNCVACHGGVRQKNGVSFIFREEALGVGKSGRRTIVPGDPDGSELIARVTSKDPDVRMPYHAPPLPVEQVSLLRRWIKEGAKWSDYWAFVPPKPQPLPPVKHANWVRQPLDRFILARLETESLLPSAEADKAALLRRVSLDLTGLPPTSEEQTTFLTLLRTLTKNKWTACWLLRPTANAGPRCGLIWHATRIPTHRTPDRVSSLSSKIIITGVSCSTR
jgi:cytochrome c/uncharacterized protein DUF1549